jgi:hypothetical protein
MGAEIDGIDHWVNEMWQIDEDVRASIEAKLNNPYGYGRFEQAEMYLRF